MSRLNLDREKAALRLEYLNAALQRAKKMPSIKDLLDESRPLTLADIKRALDEKPTFEQQDIVKE